MNLDVVRLHCEHMIDQRRGAEKAWTSEQMLDVVTDLQRIMENQRTDPHLAEQLARTVEELRAVYAENRRLMEGKPWITYRLEDGMPVAGEYAWVTEIDWFENDTDVCHVVKETWRLIATEKMVFNEYVDDENDEDSPDLLPERSDGSDGLRPDVHSDPSGSQGN